MAFSPASRPVLTPGRLIQGRTVNMASFVLKAEEKQAAEEDAAAPKVDADGTFYDDEVRVCVLLPLYLEV